MHSRMHTDTGIYLYASRHLGLSHLLLSGTDLTQAWWFRVLKSRAAYTTPASDKTGPHLEDLPLPSWQTAAEFLETTSL